MGRTAVTVRKEDEVVACQNVSSDGADVCFGKRVAKPKQIIEFSRGELDRKEVKELFKLGRLRILYSSETAETEEMKKVLKTLRNREVTIAPIESGVWEVFLP